MHQNSCYVVQVISFGQQWLIDVILQHLVGLFRHLILRLALFLSESVSILYFGCSIRGRFH